MDREQDLDFFLIRILQVNLHRFCCLVSLVMFTNLCFGAVQAQEQASNTSNSKMKYPATKTLDVVDDLPRTEGQRSISLVGRYGE